MEFLVDLKVLSNISENGRIKRDYNGKISLVHNTEKFIWLKRFISRDSRIKAIYDINKIIETTILYANNLMQSKYFIDYKKINDNINDSFIRESIDTEYYKNYNNLFEIYTELNNSLKGLTNLKNTYYDDINSKSKIDIILLQIKNFTNKIYRVLKLDNKNINDLI